ncbi:hypothetical protein PUN28_007876 [Cardiocondyla obscurior]
MIELANDVEFKSDPLVKNEITKRKYLKELKAKQDEEYNAEAQKQRYTRLMHLLNKSKFFASHISSKIDDMEKKFEEEYENSDDVNENIPPVRKMKGRKDKYKDYAYTDVKKEMQIRKKRKLNEKENKMEFCNDSDDQNPNAIDSNCFTVPKYFVGQLRNYQLKGLEWLKCLYKNGLGGILADEMGLGKTIQVIALFCHLIETQQPGPYLIIAPLSTIPNWLTEFEKFAPELPVVLFYGQEKKRQELKNKINITHIINNFKTKPIVITSYETPLFEKKFMCTNKWRYVVVDEGQRIKNYRCQLIELLKKMPSMNRLILTGTPLQNDLSELWSILNFLLPDIFDDLDTFESWFDAKELHQKGSEKILKQEEEKHVLWSLREILKPFMLRRIKTEVCLDIPPKKEIIVYAPLTKLQHNLYNAVLNYDIEMLSKIEKSSDILPTVNGERPKRQCILRKQLKNVQNKSINTEFQELDTMDLQKQNNVLMWKQYTDVTERNRDFLINIKFGNRGMMYRKIVNHPYLIHWPKDGTGLPEVDNNLIRSSGKLLVLDAMLEELKKQGHKVLLFSTMTMILDVIEDYLTLRNYNYVRLDGLTKIEARKTKIDQFNNDPDMFMFLISTRAGGVGLNLASADTVIIYDSDWNPQVDIQASARCHRIGQTRPVVIYRLCTKGTVDEMIINRAEAKRVLEKCVISKLPKFLGKESLLELKKIMSSKDYKVVTSKNEVFTKMELKNLLDRSDLIINNCDTQNSE